MLRFMTMFVLGAASLGAAQVDACGLLTSDAIRKAIGEHVANAKASSQTMGKVRQSQCFYSMPTFTNSVHVILTGPAGASRDAARELWDRWFHEADGGAGEQEAAAKASPVEGLGDEAFWVHSFVGNLYVRKGDRLLRISLGGKMNDQERQVRAKALAQAALRRLP